MRARSRTSPCSIRATRVSTERLVVEMAASPGPGLHAHVAAEDAGHLRTRRDVSDRRAEGAARRARDDVATVVGAGVTVFEALKAYDQLKAEGIAIRVIDLVLGRSRSTPTTLIAAGDARRAARSSRSRITTPPAASATRSPKRWRRRASRSTGSRCARFRAAAQPDELLDRFGISARHIVEAVRQIAQAAQRLMASGSAD